MKHILACTDGSLYAPSVYDHTAWAAKRTGASVHILHMLDPHRERSNSMDLSGNIGPDTGDALLQELVTLEESKSRLARERGKQVFQRARDHLAAAGVTDVSVQQLHGALVETVTEQEKDADLVVLGKRGEAADFAKGHLGSNLERVIRASIRPVLVTSRAFEPIEEFLVAYDGGPSVEKAIGFAIENPLLRGLKCHLLRAGRIDSNAEWLFHEAAAKLRAAGYDVETHIAAGEPEKVIPETIARTGIRLLVMGAYGLSRIRQFLIGSTTTEMVRTCHVPVLLFR